jgi:hypothetical protein
VAKILSDFYSNYSDLGVAKHGADLAPVTGWSTAQELSSESFTPFQAGYSVAMLTNLFSA